MTTASDRSVRRGILLRTTWNAVTASGSRIAGRRRGAGRGGGCSKGVGLRRSRPDRERRGGEAGFEVRPSVLQEVERASERFHEVSKAVPILLLPGLDHLSEGQNLLAGHSLPAGDVSRTGLRRPFARDTSRGRRGCDGGQGRAEEKDGDLPDDCRLSWAPAVVLRTRAASGGARPKIRKGRGDSFFREHRRSPPEECARITAGFRSWSSFLRNYTIVTVLVTASFRSGLLSLPAIREDIRSPQNPS